MMNSEVRSAVRVLELLEYLSRSPGPAALKDVVGTLGFPKSSAHALLQTLVSRGYVERDGTDRYALAEGFRDGAAWVGGHQARLLAAACPVLEELRDALRETVMIGVRGAGGEVGIAAKLVSPEEIRYDTDMNGLRPAYCTAMGRVLLAHWDEDAREDYLARTPLEPKTPRTITDPDALRAVLHGVRAKGHAIADEEMVIGGVGTAAPIFDGRGQCVAALNVATVTHRYRLRGETIIEGVMRGAARISRQLGFRPHGAAREAGRGGARAGASGALPAE
jgi:DNA-binding IclR family transcriptional regulator